MINRYSVSKHWRDSSPGKLTVFVLDAALVCPVAARLGLELNVAELQHSCHQLQHRLHFILHKTHDLHGILGREWKKKEELRCYQVRNVNPRRHKSNKTKVYFSNNKVIVNLTETVY